MGLKAGRILISLSFFVMLSSPRASADALPVGVLSFDQLQADPSGISYGIDVTNLTAISGLSPVTTVLSFDNLVLTVDLSGGGSMPVALTPVDPFGDFTTGSIFALGDVLSATLTGSFSPTSVTLADGSTANIDPSFTAVLNDPTGPLQSGDFVYMNANTVVQGVPEPGSLLLLGIPFFLLALSSRCNSRCRAWLYSVSLR